MTAEPAMACVRVLDHIFDSTHQFLSAMSSTGLHKDIVSLWVVGSR